MVPYSNFVSLERIYGPEQNLDPDNNNGFISAHDQWEMLQLAISRGGLAIRGSGRNGCCHPFPEGVFHRLAGLTRKQIASGNQAVYIFLDMRLVNLFYLVALRPVWTATCCHLPVILVHPACRYFLVPFLLLYLTESGKPYLCAGSRDPVDRMLGKNAYSSMHRNSVQSRQEGMGIPRTLPSTPAVERPPPRVWMNFFLPFISGTIPPGPGFRTRGCRRVTPHP